MWLQSARLHPGTPQVRENPESLPGSLEGRGSAAFDCVGVVSSGFGKPESLPGSLEGRGFEAFDCVGVGVGCCGFGNPESLPGSLEGRAFGAFDCVGVGCCGFGLDFIILRGIVLSLDALRPGLALDLDIGLANPPDLLCPEVALPPDILRPGVALPPDILRPEVSVAFDLL
jgi:hypothetical protein